jgi:D-tyrosyl-tRNA(Tyr) deacylase
MRIVLQRVQRGSVSVGGKTVAEIGVGMVILLGVGRGDRQEEAQWLAEKCANLRVFEDSEGKTNLSIKDVGGEALVVSQFTLYADVRKGRRPSFVDAADPGQAEGLVDFFVAALQAQDVPTKKGVFAAHMVVEIENDGPVTIVLEREGG